MSGITKCFLQTIIEKYAKKGRLVMQRELEAACMLATKYFEENKNYKLKCTKCLLSKIRVYENRIKRCENFFSERQNVALDNNAKSALLWLFDNMYIFRDTSLNIRNSLSREKNIQSDRDGNIRIFRAFCKFYACFEKEISKEQLLGFAKVCGKAGMGFCDLYFLETCVRLCALREVSKVCESLVTGQDTYILNASFVKKAILTLKNLESLDVEELFDYLDAEKTLLKDGAYPKMTKESKRDLRMRLSHTARKSRQSEYEVSLFLLKKSARAKSEREKFVGSYLYENNKNISRLYVVVLCTATLLSTVILMLLQPLFVLCALPLFDAFKILLDRVFSKRLKERVVPCIELSQIPDDSGVLVVITSLLCGKMQDKHLFSNLENMYNMCGGKNVYFAILGDLKDAKERQTKYDKSVIDNAKNNIKRLCEKYGNSFFLFVRQRQYSKTQEAFIAPERKRGAVRDLCLFLSGKSDVFCTESLKIPKSLCDNIKYCITLDADTQLSLGSVTSMVGAMIHPQNKPEVDKDAHAVKSGCAIMQPRVETTLESAGKTNFSLVMSGGGGNEIYAKASFNLDMSLFDNGIFCGKGIIDVRAFCECFEGEGELENERILSHDSIEGARLLCKNLDNVTLFDNFPKNELSYYKRLHRWIRGDMQNLVFLKKYTKNSSGKTIKNTITPVYKMRIFENVRRAISPVMSLFAVVLSAIFLKGYLKDLVAFFATFHYFLYFFSDFVAEIFKTGFDLSRRRFYSKGIRAGLWQSFLRCIFDVCLVPKSALVCLDATLRSVYRSLFSRKNMLEWTTAMQSDNESKDGLLGYIHKNIFECALGVFVFVISGGGYCALLGLLWFFMPVIMYFSSKPRKAEVCEQTSDVQKLKLRDYARDMWRFFEKAVSQEDNYLPCDNIQLFSGLILAHRTSPTNIGLYILSILIARRFEFIDTNSMVQRLSDTIGTVEKLRKYKGNLYNWYDTRTLDVLKPEYVSSVDTGNFLACLICSFEGLDEYQENDGRILQIRKRIYDLYNNCDIECMFSKDKNLFSLGLEFDGNTPKQSINYYDLLMSEARTLSYIAVSRRMVPKSHYERLSRRLVKTNAHLGIYSWTGCAFEYFMPSLFMPTKQMSLYEEALKFAFYQHKKQSAVYKNKRVFGISESGYFAFDYEMNYQYRAFGANALSLCNQTNNMVISPYSSFLFLNVSKKSAMQNLENLKKLGMYSRYGFYEAADFSKDRVKFGYEKIKSHMSHHVGMSFCACANAVFDGYVQKLFMKNDNMRAGQELLCEKFPVNAFVPKKSAGQFRASPKKKTSKNASFTIPDPDKNQPFFDVISDGKSNIICSDNGFVSMNFDSLCVNDTTIREKQSLMKSLLIFIKIDDCVYSMNSLLNMGENVEYLFETDIGKMTYIVHILSKDGQKYTAKAQFTMDAGLAESAGFIVDVKVSSEEKNKDNSKNVQIAIFTDIVLASHTAHTSHRAFSNLFVESGYLEDADTLIFARRTRDDKEKRVYLSVNANSNGKKCTLCTSKSDVFGFPMSQESFEKIFDFKGKIKLGACLYPCLYVKTSQDNLTLKMCASYDRKSCLMSLEELKEKNFEQSVETIREVALSFFSKSGYYSNIREGLFEKQKLLSKYIFPDYYDVRIEDNSNEGMNYLWKMGISGDFPIVCAHFENLYALSHLERYLRAFHHLLCQGIRMDFVILYSEKDRYTNSQKKLVESLCERAGCKLHIGAKHGGIFIAEKREFSDGGDKLLKISAFILQEELLKEESNGISLNDCTIILGEQHENGIKDTLKYFETATGYFESDFSFVAEKSKSLSRPMTHILSGGDFSCVVDNYSLGYTFFENCAEKRITPFYNDESLLKSSERIFAKIDGKLYDLVWQSYKVKYSFGYAQYFGKIMGYDYTLKVFVPKGESVKLMSLLTNAPFEIVFAVKPIMSRNENDTKKCAFGYCSGSVTFKNLFSQHFCDTGFVFGLEKLQSGGFCEAGCVYSDNGMFEGNALVFAKEQSENVECERNIVFALGCAKDENGIFELMKKTRNNFEGLFESALEFSNVFASKIVYNSKKAASLSKASRLFFNKWLCYQTSISRFFARSGFYQSSGAFGFRDQLQDCIALMYCDKDLMRNHILSCCAHQFEEGDVMHWWHPKSDLDGKSDMGVRSRFCDDYVFLPYVVARYVLFSGDMTILQEKVPYLKAPLLKEGENERLDRADISSQSTSVYHHCLKAIMRALRLKGERGLCLIGGGDWCDGMNALGLLGKGESVWLSMFVCLTLSEFSKVCEKYDDLRTAGMCIEERKKLSKSICENGFDTESGYFLRAFSDEGVPVGKRGALECEIDLLPQAFCAISDVCDKDKMLSSLYASYKRLYDKENKILKLLSPPFDNPPYKVGYIKGYSGGIRENGGQYTHAAIWGAMGYFYGSMKDGISKEDKQKLCKLGFEILTDQLTPLRMSDQNLSKKYKAEPYVLAGDIYSNKNFPARAGWSWYTGSAGWMWTVFLECVFCIRISDAFEEKMTLEFSDNVFYVPFLLDDEFEVNINIPKSDREITVKYKSGTQNAIFLDGKESGKSVKIKKGTKCVIEIMGKKE